MTRKTTRSGSVASPVRNAAAGARSGVGSREAVDAAGKRRSRGPATPEPANPELADPPGAAPAPLPAGPAEPAPRCATLIELDAAPSGGLINGRLDIQLRGHVVAAEPVEAVELVIEAGAVGRIDFGDPQSAATVSLPDGTQGREHCFHFSLQREPGTASETCRVHIRALLPSGPVEEQAFDLAIDAANPEPVHVVSGPTQPLLALSGTRPPIILYVERALLDAEGGLLLHGWAVAMNPLVTVQAFLGDQRLPAAHFGAQRDDVLPHYPAYPNARNSGFSLSTQTSRALARSAAEIRVQAISRSGFSHEVVVPVERSPARTRQPAAAEPAGFRPGGPVYKLRAAFQMVPDNEAGIVTQPVEPPLPEAAVVPPDPARELRYFCDDALFRADGTLHVVGWAVCQAGLQEIAIELDGTPIGTAELGLSRPDVGKEFADIPAANFSGFRFEQIIPDISEGAHQLRLVLRNVAGDERSESKQLHAQQPASGVLRRDPPKPAEAPEFRFELDSPQVVGGAVVEPVTGRLTIEGWVLARSGVAGIDVYLDDQRLGEAHYGLARQDVGAAFPEWDNALRSGYAFHCPPRALRDGTHVVVLEIRAKNGQVLERRFHIDVKKSEQDDPFGSIHRRMGRLEAMMQSELLDELGYRPNFHLLLRQGPAIVLDGLHATLNSLRTQSYAAWRATVLAEDPDAAFAVRLWLAENGAEYGHRVTLLDGTQPGFDAPLPADDDDAALFAMLCPGDQLSCDALAEIALAGGLHRQPDFLYGDEVRMNPASKEREPFFKPDFSPDLLLSTNYIGRPWFASGALLRQCGLTPRGLFAAGEYDLVLRCTERARTIHHIAKLLAQRGPAAPDDDAADQAALAQAASRRGFAAEVRPGCLPGTFRLRRTQRATGKVSIVIPTCAAHGHIETCIRTLRETTAYKNFEIVCIDNIPAGEAHWKTWLRQHADRVVDIPDAFNWSRFNNVAAASCDGEYLLFLNDDIEITDADWLDALLEHAQRPEVGIVGPQLLYPGGRVQHAGMFLGLSVGRHAFRFSPHDEPGYFGLALTQRNVIAVTGACMLMRRSFFEAMRGFEEAHSVINNDLDFCLRAHQAGKLTVFTPYASLLHHELASRDRMGDTFDTAHFDARWRTTFAAGDPYFSPRLARNADDYRPDDEAVQTVYPAHPLFDRAEIQRILVMKLDHIGDVITALPAIRRLKALFPHASLTMLASRGARSVIELEPAIDDFIAFDFFHARSQLGEKQLTKEDFEALREQLAPGRFDLAIDLRKHLSTRDLLRYSGARYLAGYDYAGQFPYLDVALEWDGDKTLLRKRSHVVDDLLALVEAVGTASMTDRTMFAAPPAPLPLEALPASVRALFERPVVAIHAGAGTVTRQWPQENFSALIDLLIERDLVNVLLVGGPDDRQLSDSIVRQAQQPDRVASVAGMLSLAELPRLLVRCRLYVGSNSGPQHIAAAAGVASIGIHSGVVDAIEWGPVGRRAVALWRNMACSPCYLARADDCPRGMACLRGLEPAAVHEVAQSFLARPISAPALRAATEQPAELPFPVARRRPSVKTGMTRATIKGAKPGNGAAPAPGPEKPAGGKPGVSEPDQTRSKAKFRTKRQGAPA